MRSQRVVITGIGIVSPFGIGKDAFWDHVADSSVSGDAAGLARQVPDFDLFALTGLQESAHTRHLDRYSKYAVLGSKLALDDAKLRIDGANAERVGVVFGSDYGCLTSNCQHIQNFDTKGPRRVDPVVFQSTVSNTVNGYTSILLGAMGPSTMVSDRVSGYLALCVAHDLVASGKADAVIAGGVEELSSSLAMDAGFRARALGCHRSSRAPIDGATVFVVESEQSARARGGRIYATFKRYHLTPAAETEQALGRHVGSLLEKIIAGVGAQVEPINALFCESENGIATLGEVLSAAGQPVALALPSRLLGPALASTPTPAACVLSVAAGAIPASIDVNGVGAPIAGLADAPGCAAAVKVEADGSTVVLVFGRELPPRTGNSA